jgi:hypothetical protein
MSAQTVTIETPDGSFSAHLARPTTTDAADVSRAEGRILTLFKKALG